MNHNYNVNSNRLQLHEPVALWGNANVMARKQANVMVGPGIHMSRVDCALLSAGGDRSRL